MPVKPSPLHDVYIVGATRTAVARGSKKGAYFGLHPVDLFAHTLKEVTKRAGVDPSEVEDVIAGCVTPMKEQGANVGRLGALKAGFPITVPGVQVNRMCGSGLQAIQFAAHAIASGSSECVIGGGVEMMSTVRMGLDTNLLDRNPPDSVLGFIKSFPHRLLNQGVSAELIAEKYGFTRAELDALAAESHRRADAATRAGIFAREILPVAYNNPLTGKSGVLGADEGIRYPVNNEKMASLKTIFKPNGGVVTAGNASQISDGAAAVLLCSGAHADKLRVRKRARIIATTVVGSDPVLMLTGPIPATHSVLAKAGLSLADIDIVEINEAFASVVMAWMKEFNIDPKDPRVNPNGGAMATGHPLGATGAILITKALHELERTNKRYALAVLCIGHGNAVATIIERVDNDQARF